MHRGNVNEIINENISHSALDRSGEFIDINAEALLLLHPFLERITYHSPVLMLMALVCIAALLVPLHHKAEKWATTKLCEKNKQKRLAAARKTIEELQ